LSINYYNKYRHFIKIDKEDKELNGLYNVLDDLINQYKRDITLDEFKLSALTKFPDYEEQVRQVEVANIGDDVLKDSITQLVDRSQARDLAILCIDVTEGRKTIGDIMDFYTRFETRETLEEVEFVTDDLEMLYNETVHKAGLRWRLPTLNKMMGSLRKGDFGFLFARPETGKTTFLASEVTHMAAQTERPILWFNNEEQGMKVKVRCYQATLGCNLAQLYTDRPRAYKEYMKRTKGNIKIFDSASVNKRTIEAICKEHEPALIIFDQIDKVKGFNADREDLRLGSIYIWARELAKTYAPVIGVCQSDVTGEGKKYLDMGNVANAKTSKQAEADWILGIGAIHDVGFEFMRYLHLSKNKLSGDEDTDPTLRHGKTEVIIHPDIARYKER